MPINTEKPHARRVRLNEKAIGLAPVTADGLRQIAPIDMPGLNAQPVTSARPVFEMARPCDLYIDPTYQRILSEKSLGNIRRIHNGWDWRKFQPPACVRVDGKLHLLDGQHTAIAASMRTDIDLIPIMVVEAPDAAQRADAFVGRNRDRTALHSTQLYASAVIAGDPWAVAIDRVSRAAGARILKLPPTMGLFKPGDIIAIAGVGSLIARRDEAAAIRVIKIGVTAHLTPITIAWLRAIENALFVDPHGARLDDDVMIKVIADKGTQLLTQAQMDRAATNQLLFSVLAGLLADAVIRAGGLRPPAPLKTITSPAADAIPKPIQAPARRPAPKPAKALIPKPAPMVLPPVERKSPPMQLPRGKSTDPALIEAAIAAGKWTKCPTAYLEPVNGAEPLNNGLTARALAITQAQSDMATQRVSRSKARGRK